MKKDVKKLFVRKAENDKKHRLNVSLKKIPKSIYETIDRGITIEKLEELLSKEFQIFKYGTQITIHGIFDSTHINGYCQGYKNLILNKNQSLGVKYSAIDVDKKQFIADHIESTFSYTRKSNVDYFSHIEVAENENEAIEKIEKFKKQNEEINTNLFIGETYVSSFSIWGRLYVSRELIINSIYERDVIPFIENIMNKPFDQIKEDLIKKEASEKEAYRIWEQERKQQKEKEQQEREQALSLLQIPKEFVKGKIIISPDIIVCKKNYNTNTKEASFSFYKFEKRKRTLWYIRCTENGTPISTWDLGRKVLDPKEPKEVYYKYI